MTSAARLRGCEADLYLLPAPRFVAALRLHHALVRGAQLRLQRARPLLRPPALVAAGVQEVRHLGHLARQLAARLVIVAKQLSNI